MKTYIGVKKIEAEPMTRGDYNTYRGWQIPTEVGRYLQTKTRLMKVIILNTQMVTNRGHPKKILKTHFLKKERIF